MEFPQNQGSQVVLQQTRNLVDGNFNPGQFVSFMPHAEFLNPGHRLQKSFSSFDAEHPFFSHFDTIRDPA